MSAPAIAPAVTLAAREGIILRGLDTFLDVVAALCVGHAFVRNLPRADDGWATREEGTHDVAAG